jgi:hypothetical protein
MKKVLILLGFTFCCLETTAQVNKPKPDTLKTPLSVLSEADDRAKKFLPQYAPLSPNASISQKFGDYQVNLATGVPSIPITLFTVQDGSLSVPITLNYHAGGFKMNEMASWVGWGMFLDFGPSINRVVQGLKDDNSGGNYLTNPITASRDFCNNTNDFNYGKSVVANTTDTQPDIFSYKTADKSGKFLLGQNGALPFKIPNYPILISYSGNPTITSFNLLDDSGISYDFGGGTPSAVESQTVTSSSSTQNYISSWLISQIKSPNSNDAINYSYQSGGGQYLSEKQWFSSLLYGAVPSSGGHYENSTSSIPTYTNVSTSITQINPYKITYTNGEVEFIQSNEGERLDLTNSRYLKQINVYNYESGVKTLIKVFKFTYSYFSGIRLKLDKLTVIDANNTTTEEYLFDYWTNTLSWNEVTDNEKKDFFGYYNGKPNTHLIPVSSYQGVAIAGGAADRSTVDTYMKEGVLKRITFPTKGYTEFDYETHKYSDGTNVLFAGGLRVKSIKSYSGGSTLLKRYEYSSSAGAGIGRLTTSWTPTSAGTPTIQYLRYDDQEGNANSFGTAYQASFTQSGGVIDLNTMDSAPVYYTDVTEYFEDVSDPTKNGRNVYTFDFENDIIANPFTYPTRNVKPWKRGNLQTKTTYDTANTIVASVSKQYQEHQSNTRLAGAFVNAPNVYSGFGVGGCSTGLSSSFPEMIYGSVYYQTGINLLVGSINYIDNVSSSQSMSYTSNLLIAQSQSTDSQSGMPPTEDTKTESFIYPTDASYSSNTIAQSMVTRNMLNTPLETEIKKTISGNTSTVYKEKKVFDFFSGSNARGLSNNILLKELWFAPKGGTLEKRVVFTDYATNGKPLSYKVDDLPISLFWGYNDALLLAEVKNATKSELDAALSTAGITANNFSVNNLSAGQLSQLQTLRNALPVRQVSWFTHRPFVGMAQIIGGDGIKTAFVFDALNRLKLIKDHDLNITDKYSYVYASSLPTCTPPSPPTVSISNTTLCYITLSASGCGTPPGTGTVNWSNGSANNNITVSSKTTQTFTATCADGSCVSSASNSLTIPILPSSWTSGDIGSAAGGVPPSCTQNNYGTPPAGALALQGSGSVGGSDDIFHWIYKSMTGDFTMIAKINNLPAVDGQRSGIMIRSNTNSNAQFYTLIQDGNANVGQLKRDSNGGTGGLYSFAGSAVNQTWIKIVKTGTSIKAYHSTDSNPELNNQWDENFNLTGTAPTTLDFGSKYLIGLVTYGSVNQTTFTNITINGNAF